MKLLHSIARLLPTERHRQGLLDHSRLSYWKFKRKHDEENRSRKQIVINDIKRSIPADVADSLRSDLRYGNYVFIRDCLQREDELGLPKRFFKQPDPRTVIPKDDRRCVKALSVAKRKKGGRNNRGWICTRRIGGGFKRRIRLLDRHRLQQNPQRVVRIEHDPNRSAKLMLLQDTITNILSYRIAVDGVQPGHIIKDTLQGRLNEEQVSADSEEYRPVDPVESTDAGSCLPLRLIPLGARIHDIETVPHSGGKLVKAAGTFATLVGHLPGHQNKSLVRLPSGQTKKLPSTCRASLGVVGNGGWHLRVLGKAGRSRNLGIRPHVRGVAMNACDHPHGGGKGGRGKGKPSQSPWGKVCK